jgi:magnesium-transporting ATPase (P-type)
MSEKVQKEATPYHTQDIDTVLKNLQTNAKTGLTLVKAAENLQKFGPNELSKPEGESLFDKIKEQFEDLLVRILLAAAAISFVVSFFGKLIFKFE